MAILLNLGKHFIPNDSFPMYMFYWTSVYRYFHPLHPAFAIFVSISLCSDVFDLPLFLLPGGFHVSACLVICCLHFLILIVTMACPAALLSDLALDPYFVRCHGASLLIVSGHHILKIVQYYNKLNN